VPITSRAFEVLRQDPPPGAYDLERMVGQLPILAQ
jgi:hypothetical protein